MTNKESLLNRLKSTFMTQPWYGDSVMKTIKSIPFEAASYSPIGVNDKNIAKLVAHIIVWIEFGIEKLDENRDFDIELGTSLDWPEVDINTSEEWDNLLIKLVSTYDLLVEKIKSIPDQHFIETVAGKSYKTYFMLDGIVQHNIYHLGQIGIFYAMYKNSR